MLVQPQGTYILLFDVADNGAEAGLAVFLTIQFSQQLSHVSLTVVVGTLSIAGTVNARAPSSASTSRPVSSAKQLTW